MGPYCHVCGESRSGLRDLSLRAFLRNSVDAFTDLDSRVWRSLRALVVSPGLLTREWMRGRRRPWLAPLRVFLIANVIYFLVQSITGFEVFTTRLETHTRGTLHRGIAAELVHSRLAATGEEYEQFRDRFDRASRTHAKSLVIVTVPFLALLFGLIELRGRRPLAVHLVFALHFFAFVFLFASTVDLIAFAVGHVRPTLVNEWVLTLLYAVCIVGHLHFAMIRAYGNGPVPAMIRTAFALGALIVVILGYRALLFFTVFLTI